MVDLPVTDLAAMASAHLEAAAGSGSRRSAATVHGGGPAALSQTLMALLAGASLGEHENPGDATVQVLVGRVRLEWEGGSVEAEAGQLVPIPPARHSLAAITDSAVLLSVTRGSR